MINNDIDIQKVFFTLVLETVLWKWILLNCTTLFAHLYFTLDWGESPSEPPEPTNHYSPEEGAAASQYSPKSDKSLDNVKDVTEIHEILSSPKPENDKIESKSDYPAHRFEAAPQQVEEPALKENKEVRTSKDDQPDVRGGRLNNDAPPPRVSLVPTNPSPTVKTLNDDVIRNMYSSRYSNRGNYRNNGDVHSYVDASLLNINNVRGDVPSTRGGKTSVKASKKSDTLEGKHVSDDDLVNLLVHSKKKYRTTQTSRHHIETEEGQKRQMELSGQTVAGKPTTKSSLISSLKSMNKVINELDLLGYEEKARKHEVLYRAPAKPIQRSGLERQFNILNNWRKRQIENSIRASNIQRLASMSPYQRLLFNRYLHDRVLPKTLGTMNAYKHNAVGK